MTPGSMASDRTSGHIGVIDRLQQTIETTLADIVDPAAKFALLDFPNYDNIGDSAIYMGELAYFDRHGMRASYVSSIDDFDALSMDKAIGDGSIYLQGGGNFGDIWPWFQPFRESILARYKGRRVVQMPQTIHYSSEERLDQTARIVEKHGAFTLLVRDHPSYDLATRKFQCDVRLCPDMAFAMGPIISCNASRYQLMLHMRNDKESTGKNDAGQFAGNPAILIADWPKERKRHMIEPRVAASTILTGGLLQDANRRREIFYRNLARFRLQRGVSQLSQARAVITDRLHGHIIATLMGHAQGVLDNSYGKTSNFISAWATLYERANLFHSLVDGVNHLRMQEHLSF